MGVWGFLPSGHPCLVWKAFLQRRLGPAQLLAFLQESGLLRSLKVREAIIPFENQTEVWLKMGNRSILHLFPALHVGGWRSLSVSSLITTDGSISVPSYWITRSQMGAPCWTYLMDTITSVSWTKRRSGLWVLNLVCMPPPAACNCLWRNVWS